MSETAGVFYRQSHEEVRCMLYKLNHRGPDGEGIQDLSAGTLGHKRLALIDVDGGHQPMNVGDAWIVFNGEIYDFRDLAEEHLSDQTLNTHSDTEVLLRLYLKYGPKYVELFRGMFAFVIVRGEEIFLARDPLGIKPLYWGNGENGFYFASERKALAVATSEIYEFPAGHWYHSTKGWNAYYRIVPASLSSKTKKMQ